MTSAREDIRAKVDGLLSEFGIGSLPVNVEKLAGSLGVEIYYDDLEDDISGFLAIKNGKATIVVNEGHHQNRRRFTIAHELGHFFLHVKDLNDEELFIDKVKFHRDQMSALGVERREVEANRFAAELLMPEDLLFSKAVEFSGQGFDITDKKLIEDLARSCMVSEQALTIRLGDLFLIGS